MNGADALVSNRDWDGGVTSRVVQGLSRASRPLSIDWVRRFVLQHGDLACDLSFLTSKDAVSSATVLTGVFHTTAHNHGGIALAEQSLTANCLLVPCITVGEDTVGLVVQREGRTSDFDGTELETSPADAELDALYDLMVPPGSNSTVSEYEHSVGRFYFSNATGELLMLSHLLPDEGDLTMTALTLLSLKSGEAAALQGARSAATKSRTRVSWWSPVNNEKLTAVVDTALFEAGMNAQAILVANHSRCAARLACAECSARDLMRTAGNNGLVQLSVCDCQRPLFIPEASRDFKRVFANVRASQCGLWAGPADEVSRLLGRPGPLVIARQNLSMSLEFDGDAALGIKLRDLAIAQCVSQVCVPRLVANAIFDDGIESGILASASFVEPSAAASSVHSETQEGALRVLATDDDADDREARSEARRQRNRVAAARSNAKRKARNDGLKQAISAARSRVSLLLGIERNLRIQNAELRTVLEAAQATATQCRL
jgi:hypothetical protein